MKPNGLLKNGSINWSGRGIKIKKTTITDIDFQCSLIYFFDSLYSKLKDIIHGKIARKIRMSYANQTNTLVQYVSFKLNRGILLESDFNIAPVKLTSALIITYNIKPRIKKE